jgi:hypothetical protein
LKKNPFLSMWLSSANAVAGSVRSRTKQQVRRQSATAARNATKAMFEAWTGAVIKPPRKKTKRKKR